MLDAFLDPLSMEITLKLLLSLLLGAVIGVERELKRKPAGLKTHMLVSMGACLFTIVSISGFSIDPARVAGGIVTGIGFIGAGSIMASKFHVNGITTAATLWVVAAVGLSVGANMYTAAVITSLFVFIVLQLGWIEREFEKGHEK